MNEQFIYDKDEGSETEYTNIAEEDYSADDILVSDDDSNMLTTSNKKKFAFCGCILVAIIAIAIALSGGTKFGRVKNKVVDIAGMAGTGEGYFIIDTYPDVYKNMDKSVASMLLPTAEENALKAIKYANHALGFNDSLYGKMTRTSALMGRQSEENKKYKVTWTYHPNDGLEVTYEKK